MKDLEFTVAIRKKYLKYLLVVCASFFHKAVGIYLFSFWTKSFLFQVGISIAKRCSAGKPKEKNLLLKFYSGQLWSTAPVTLIFLYKANTV